MKFCIVFKFYRKINEKKVINILVVNNIERLILMFSFLFGVFVLSMLEKIIYIKFYIIFFERKNI